MSSATDSRGVAVTYSHADPLARLVGITYQTGSSDDVTLSYDGANDVVGRNTANGGSFSYTYDELNRLTSQTWHTPVWGGYSYQFSTNYTYDQYGCLAEMIYPTGTRLTMTCDTQNRVTSINAMHLSGSVWMPIGMSVSGIAYHTSGKPSAMTLGNGVVASFTYDGRARVTGVSDLAGGESAILGLSYTYDGADNVTSFNNSSVSGSSRTMTYDAVNKLETEIAPNMWGTAAYSYDALGNRTMSSEGSYTTNYTYDSQTGRLLSQTGGQSHPAAASYTWDLPGRLASSSDGNTYKYDSAYRRVAKLDGTTTVVYHYDAGGRLIAETNGFARIREYFYVGNILVGVNDCSSGSCAVEYYHSAANGSVLAVTDMSGTLQFRLDYYPSGQLWNPPSNPGERQHRARLVEAGLCGSGRCTLSLGTGGVLRRAGWSSRPYSPMIGRFIAPRPKLIRGQSFASRLGFTHRQHLKIPRSVRLSRAYTGIIGRPHMLASVRLSRAYTGIIGRAHVLADSGRAEDGGGDVMPAICAWFAAICAYGCGPLCGALCWTECYAVQRGWIRSPPDSPPDALPGSPPDARPADPGDGGDDEGDDDPWGDDDWFGDGGYDDGGYDDGAGDDGWGDDDWFGDEGDGGGFGGGGYGDEDDVQLMF